MTQTDSAQEWLEEVPPSLQALMVELRENALIALKKNTPYHSVRISEGYHTQAGRTVGWCVSATTEVGWEYENTTCDRFGTLLLMFKNPYIFS
jgi:hypothetical protein